MQGVVIFAWVYFAAAVVAAGMGVNYGSPVLFATSLTAVLAGVLLLAVDRALTRLTEIRDAVRGELPSAPESVVSGAAEAAGKTDHTPSMAELDKRLKELREKSYRPGM